MVGFNRRFAPLAKLLKHKLGDGPMSMIYRINAGAIPPDNWIQDPDIGGGRIIGEVCHFVDFMTFMCGSLPVRVFASSVPDPHNLNDVINISLEFQNGSIGTISYFANGAKNLAKEYIEIYGNGTTGILKDFKQLEIYGGRRTLRKKLFSQDKGQKQMISTFIDVIKNGCQSPISFEEIYSVTMTTLRTIESLQSRKVVNI
jgi:predicted dehydrogenase